MRAADETERAAKSERSEVSQAGCKGHADAEAGGVEPAAEAGGTKAARRGAGGPADQYWCGREDLNLHYLAVTSS